MSMILVVIDDDPANIKFVRFILANEDLEIQAATDPQTGMDLIRRTRPQIVLLDLVMPGMSGRTLVETLSPLRPDMRVLYMSGYTDGVMAKQGVTQAGLFILRKPFSKDELTRRVMDLTVGVAG